jgi:hypothetical protein
MQHARRLTLLAGLWVAACGDNRPDLDGRADAAVDAAVDAALDAALLAPGVEPECHQELVATGTVFDGPEDLGPLTPATLAGFDPTGRWFIDGLHRWYDNSMYFERAGDEVVIDRREERRAALTDDSFFVREEFAFEGAFVYALRVSDRTADGELTLAEAFCEGGACQVCTSRLHRAGRPPGEDLASNLSLLGEFYGSAWTPGYTFNVRVLGSLAYVVRIDGLHIIDVSDPAAPVELGSYYRGGDSYTNDVKLVEADGRTFAILADTPVDVVDVTTPAAPFLVGQIAEASHTAFVESHGGRTYAYFGNYSGDTPMYDVTDPTVPQFLGRYFAGSAEGLVHDLYVEDAMAYLNAWDAGFQIVDFTAPDAPVLVGAWTATPTRTSHSSWVTTIAGKRVAVHGDEGSGARLSVVDVEPGSATFMTELGGYQSREFTSIHNVMAFGSRAYVAYYQDGVRILDLSDPTAPALLGYYNTWRPDSERASSSTFDGAVGLDVDLTNRLIYVADSNAGLMILRDDTPAP